MARRPAEAFLVFEFENPPSTTSKIVLRASGCKSCEAPLLATHRIPAVASPEVLAAAEALGAALNEIVTAQKKAAKTAKEEKKRVGGGEGAGAAEGAIAEAVGGAAATAKRQRRA